MNNLYFACSDCKTYTDAGYRWAYSTLEDTGLVQQGNPVSITAILAAEEYWNPPLEEASRWLYDEVLPGVRVFLEEHKKHRVIFAEAEGFLFFESAHKYFEWLQVGYLAEISPRTLVEKLGFTTWEAATEYLSKMEVSPWWWDHTEDYSNKAKAKFEELLGRR
jgi:hypothetical protein